MAEELRLKSYDDLHKLWYVLLKEKNLLLTERLWYRHIGQMAPSPGRMLKVRPRLAQTLSCDLLAVAALFMGLVTHR